MPKRGELRVSPLRVAISRGMKWIDENQFRGSGYRDEIVNSALLEIATGQSLCLQRLAVDDENRGVESAAYGQNVH
jgi:hypothetical protein